MHNFRRLIGSTTAMGMVGLFIMLLFALAVKAPGIVVYGIAFVILLWGAIITLNFLKFVLDKDFWAFEEEMALKGFTRSGQVQVSKDPSGYADIITDSLFQISYDGGKHWQGFTAGAGVYHFRSTIISRRSMDPRKDAYLMYYKKTNSYFIYEY